MDGTVLIHLSNKIEALVSWEHLIALLFFAFLSWIFYELGLRGISSDRHFLLAQQFKGLLTLAVFLTLAYGFHVFIGSYRLLVERVHTISIYSGLLSLFLGAGLLVKILKIGAFEYFFFTNMRVGVPILLINVCSLILSLLMGSWILSSLFHVQLSSLLATSAVLSIILGLALQDTLGNLFAAISLQIDKPFELEDWIELKGAGEKITGQVKELSWRATLLLAVTDEFISIPNRTLAQCQIINFSGRIRPFYRGCYFRLPFDSDLTLAKECFAKAAGEIPEILSHPPTLSIITETTESWITFKVVYALQNFGVQFLVADRFQTLALQYLKENAIELAGNRIHYEASPRRDYRNLPT